jgi:hypothetical protein
MTSHFLEPLVRVLLMTSGTKQVVVVVVVIVTLLVLMNAYCILVSKLE